MTLSWLDILKFPKTVSVSDFHCVEGWSVLNCKWEGIRFSEITRLAKPAETAQFVTFEGADGYTTSLSLAELAGGLGSTPDINNIHSYTTSLSLAELAGDDVLLAYGLDGKPLEEGVGFPLRLVVPSKYAYKSALWVTRIRFTSKKELGYWERRGYSDTADVWKNDRFSR